MTLYKLRPNDERLRYICQGMGLLSQYNRYERHLGLRQLYPIASCLAGAFLLTLTQRVTGRAGSATLVALIQFIFFPAEALWFHLLADSVPWWPLIPAVTAFFLAWPVSLAGAITGEWLGHRLVTNFADV